LLLTDITPLVSTGVLDPSPPGTPSFIIALILACDSAVA